MILFVGDSNLRNVVEENQQVLKNKLGEDTIFEQAGTNEALKTALQTHNDKVFTKVIVGTLLNEVGYKGKAVKSRDDVINNITKEQVDIMIKFADLHTNTTYIVLPPFMRFEPAWIPDKLRMITLSLKDYTEGAKRNNILFGYPVDITEGDVSSVDKVHLNESGKAKFLNSLIGDNSAIKATTMDWAQTPTPARITRSTSKRTRNASVSDEEEVVVKKRTKGPDVSTAILEKLNRMTEELREDRLKTNSQIQTLGNKLDLNVDTTNANTAKIAELSKEQETCTNVVAGIKEDLDGVENENMRDVILVRKLKTGQAIPSKKAEINEMLKTVAADLVTRVGGNPTMIKFVAMAYNEIDQTKQQGRKDLMPAFKIGFKSKENAIKFKENGTKLAKDKNGDLHKVVFAYQHCSGTRIRTQIMWKIVNKLKEQQGKEAWVNVNYTKPRIQVKSDKKFPTEYTYVAAIEKFKDLLTDDDLKEVNAQAKKFFNGQCKQLFLILKD